MDSRIVTRSSDDPFAGIARPEDLGPVFLTEEQIQERVTALGAQISRDYAGKDLVVIGVLKGVLFFLADLLRAIDTPLSMDLLAIARYGSSQQTRGVVRLTKDLNEPIAGPARTLCGGHHRHRPDHQLHHRARCVCRSRRAWRCVCCSTGTGGALST